MFSTPVAKNDVKSLRRLIEDAKKVAVTCHVKPDGDAVGSMLALWHVMSKMGKDVTSIPPDAPPRYLDFLPGCDDVAPFSQNEEFTRRQLWEADIIFCLDFNASYRVDRMEKALLEAPGKKVLIDHHLSPEQFTDITVSEPSDSSTCFLLFKVLCQLGLRPLVDKDIATCLAAGMMTDTGNFSYNANDPEIYTAMAELLTTGIDKVAIWERLNIKSENQLRLNGFALEKRMEIYSAHHASLIRLSAEDLKEFHYRKGDLEGLVNVPLQIPDINLSVLMHQEPDFVKVSMRSQGKLPVNELCEKYFSGGGHRNAAGGEFRGGMDEAKNVFEKALEEAKL